MSISMSGVASVPSPVSSSGQSSTALSAGAAKTAAQQFQEYASMTPAQRLHAQMLAKLGLTEDQFKAMSPADQQKVEDKIRDMIKQQLADNNDKRTGLITDKTA
jgi:ABC-type transporter MlaC component